MRKAPINPVSWEAIWISLNTAGGEASDSRRSGRDMTMPTSAEIIQAKVGNTRRTIAALVMSCTAHAPTSAADQQRAPNIEYHSSILSRRSGVPGGNIPGVRRGTFVASGRQRRQPAVHAHDRRPEPRRRDDQALGALACLQRRPTKLLTGRGGLSRRRGGLPKRPEASSRFNRQCPDNREDFSRATSQPEASRERRVWTLQSPSSAMIRK